MSDIFYLKYLTDDPDAVICSYLAHSKFGGEIMGFLMYPHAYCENHIMYAVNLDQMGRQDVVFKKKWGI